MTHTRWLALAPLLAILAIALPEAASACSMCLANEGEDVKYAFLWTTGFLSVLPVGMVGVAVWWLRRRVREQREQEQSQTVAAATRSTPELVADGRS